MKVLQSLMTPGGLVRTPSDHHGMVEAFDSHTNLVTVRFFDGRPDEDFHLGNLRAGNDESERQAIGKITAQFPKVLPVKGATTGQARKLSPAVLQYGDLMKLKGPLG